MDGVAAGRVEEGEARVGTEGDTEVVLGEDTLELDQTDVLEVLEDEPVVWAHGQVLDPVLILARVDEYCEGEERGEGGAKVLEGEGSGEKGRGRGSGCSWLCEVGRLDVVVIGYQNPVQTGASGDRLKWMGRGSFLMVLWFTYDHGVRTTEGVNMTKGRRAERG